MPSQIVVSPPATRVVVSPNARQPASITIKRGADLTLESISNVDSTNLQDNYVLTFDATTNKFIFLSSSELPASDNIDGGLY